MGRKTPKTHGVTDSNRNHLPMCVVGFRTPILIILCCIAETHAGRGKLRLRAGAPDCLASSVPVIDFRVTVIVEIGAANIVKDLG